MFLLIYNVHHILGLPVYLQEDSSAMVEETGRPTVSLLHVLSGLLRLVVYKLLGGYGRRHLRTDIYDYIFFQILQEESFELYLHQTRTQPPLLSTTQPSPV